MGTLRVCLLAPDFLPVWGGVGTYSVEIARELARRVELTVVTLERASANDAFSRERMEEVLDHRARVEVIARAHDNFRYNASFQLAVLRRLPVLARSERFDVLHSQHAHMPDLLYRRFDRSTPLVRTVHSTIAGQRAGIELAQRYGGGLDTSEHWQIALEPLLRAAEWLTLRDAEQFSAVSHYVESELRGLRVPRSKIRVIYNGVRTDRYRPDAPGRGPLEESLHGPLVLYAGRPTLVKGIGVFLDAIPRILEDVPTAHFAVAGSSSSVIRSLTEGRHLPTDRIHALGRVPHEDLPAVFRSADVAVAPTFADNVPFWVMEAMSSGVPVVASRVGGIPELIADGKTGILIPSGSSGALGDAVVSLLRDDGRRQAMGRAARTEVIDRFTWPRAADETVELYRATVRDGGPSRSNVPAPAPSP